MQGSTLFHLCDVEYTDEFSSRLLQAWQQVQSSSCCNSSSQQLLLHRGRSADSAMRPSSKSRPPSSEEADPQEARPAMFLPCSRAYCNSLLLGGESDEGGTQLRDMVSPPRFCLKPGPVMSLDPDLDPVLACDNEASIIMIQHRQELFTKSGEAARTQRMAGEPCDAGGALGMDSVHWGAARAADQRTGAEAWSATLPAQRTRQSLREKLGTPTSPQRMRCKVSRGVPGTRSGTERGVGAAATTAAAAAPSYPLPSALTSLMRTSEFPAPGPEPDASLAAARRSSSAARFGEAENSASAQPRVASACTPDSKDNDSAGCAPAVGSEDSWSDAQLPRCWRALSADVPESRRRPSRQAAVSVSLALPWTAAQQQQQELRHLPHVYLRPTANAGFVAAPLPAPPAGPVPPWAGGNGRGLMQLGVGSLEGSFYSDEALPVGKPAPPGHRRSWHGCAAPAGGDATDRCGHAPSVLLNRANGSPTKTRRGGWTFCSVPIQGNPATGGLWPAASFAAVISRLNKPASTSVCLTVLGSSSPPGHPPAAGRLLAADHRHRPHSLAPTGPKPSATSMDMDRCHQLLLKVRIDEAAARLREGKQVGASLRTASAAALAAAAAQPRSFKLGLV